MSTPSTADTTRTAATAVGASSATAPSGERSVVLDVLRGVALCGIVWVNVPAVTRTTWHDGPVDDVAPWLSGLLTGRFITVFAVLFGVSSALVLAAAARRSARPRVVLARRSAALLVLGLLLSLVQPAEVLTSWAVIGLVVLLPLSSLRRTWPVLVAGTAALVVAAGYGDPGLVWVGVVVLLVVLGSAAARAGLLARLERPGRGAVVVAALLVAASVTALVLQRVVTVPGVEGARSADLVTAVAALLGSACWVVVVVLALRTRVRPVLRAVFEPLGRTALTCYASAAVLAWAAGALVGQASSTVPDLLVSAGILLVQVPASRWWLARHRHGPLELVWRWATWAGAAGPAAPRGGLDPVPASPPAPGSTAPGRRTAC